MTSSRQGYAFVLSLVLHGVALGTAGMLLASAQPAGAAAREDGSRADGPAGLRGDTFDVETLLNAPGVGEGNPPRAAGAAADAAPQPPANEPARQPRSRPHRRPRATAAERSRRHRPRPRSAPAEASAAAAAAAPTASSPGPLVPAAPSSPPAPASSAVARSQAAAAQDPAEPSAVPATATPATVAAAAAAPAALPRPDGAPPSAQPAAAPAASHGHPGTTARPSASGDGAGEGGRFGAAGAPTGAVALAATFVHELPQAVAADRAWSSLAEGAVGAVDITLEIDAAGKVRLLALSDAPAPLKRIAQRTLPLLRAGVFMLSRAPGQVGREVLRVAVTLSQQAPLGHPNARPTDAFKLGSKPPVSDEPGQAYFTLASGRHFQASVTIVSSTPVAPMPVAPTPASATSR